MVISRLQRLYSSLSGRLALSVLISQAFLTALLFGIVLYGVNASLKNQFVNEVRATSGLLASVLMTVDVEREGHTVTDLLDEALLGGRIVYAELVTPEGKSVSGHNGVSDTPVAFREDLSYEEHGDSIYFIKLPLHTVQGVAMLQLGYDEQPTQQQIIRAYRLASVLVVMFMALTLLAVGFIGHKTVEPLRRLRRASREIADGQVDRHLDIDSDVSDVQELAGDLENMRGKLVSLAQQLERQAMYDCLTDLPNRALLNDRLNQAITVGSRDKSEFALLMIDLDSFKEINDTLGHYAGDKLLQEVSMRFTRALRESDTVARFGGDEFAILLHGASEAQAVAMAEKMIARIRKPFELEQQSVLLGASIGIALFPDHGNYASVLLQHADVAMYAAKKHGDDVGIYHARLDRHSFLEMSLKNDLLDGIKKQEFVVYFQPKLDLRTGRLTGAEALVRWEHPRSGLLGPDQFISLAERAGFIDPLTELVLAQSGQCYRSDLEGSDDLRIAVNLSPVSLRDEALPARIETLLARIGWSPQCLDLEITESAILQNPRQARDILNALKSLGIGIAIDDFGTGYSSLSNLRQLPVTELKIDRSFVSQMMTNSNDSAIVSATIRMAHDLGLKVTAEGVESQGIAARLIDMNCDIIQGYVLGKPMPWEDFLSWRQRFAETREETSDTVLRLGLVNA